MVGGELLVQLFHRTCNATCEGEGDEKDQRREQARFSPEDIATSRVYDQKTYKC